MTVLYPFYHSRLQPVPLQGGPDMGIVLLPGGGSSQDHRDSLTLGPTGWRITVARWAAKLAHRYRPG